MVSESFSCNLYKIVDTGERTFNITVQTTNHEHKERIFKKLSKLGHKITPKTANNKIVKLTITNIDFTDSSGHGQRKI